MPSVATQSPITARRRAAKALADFAAALPEPSPTAVDLSGLPAKETELALTIHRTAIRRWITLEYLLNGVLRQPLGDMEPAMQAVLVCGAVQGVFLDRVPHHSVVD